MRTITVYAALVAFALSLGITMDSAHAVFVRVDSDDIHECCDTLQVPELVDELGRGGGVAGAVGYPFPADEMIGVDAGEIFQAVCEEKDDPDQIDALVYITNTTFPEQSFKALWYVGNTNTYLSNVDGTVSQLGHEDLGAGLAFRIDDKGNNRPLINESLNSNGIFEPGET